MKTILFDIGGVVLHESGIESRRILCKKFGIDEDAFKKFAMRNLKFSLMGKLHYNDFFGKLAREEKINAKPEDLVKEWVKAREKTSKPNKKLIKLIKELSRKYKVGCLTNSTILNDKARQRKEIYKIFPIKFISYNLGYAKPEKQIFQIAIKRLKMELKEILIIDNSKENLETAKKLGLKTLFADNNLDKNLRKLL